MAQLVGVSSGTTRISNSFSPGGHMSLGVAFKGLHVILGLYNYNYSLIRGKELGVAAG